MLEKVFLNILRRCSSLICFWFRLVFRLSQMTAQALELIFLLAVIDFTACWKSSVKSPACACRYLILNENVWGFLIFPKLGQLLKAAYDKAVLLKSDFAIDQTWQSQLPRPEFGSVFSGNP